jgi:hypothetical protein
MPCLLNKDQPLRVQLSKNGVVHAGDWTTEGGGYRYTYHAHGRTEEKVPLAKKIRVACKWRGVDPKFEISNKESITCKSCMKAMGMIEGPVFPKRYVVRRKDTGEFYKKTASRCSVWAPDLIDAWFFKRQADALNYCKRGHYVDDEGNVHKTQEYYIDEDKRIRRGKYRYEKYLHPNFEVRTVKITLED